MALTATIHRVEIALSDVDRNVYETLDLRVARHPSETMRYMLTRTLGYALSFEEGIAFSKGGLSSAEEAPISIHDPTGILLAWIDIGSPSAERLHKASKAARRVSVFTHVEIAALRKEAALRPIHRAEDIQIWKVETAFLDALEAKIDRTTKLELVRNEGVLYATVGNAMIEGKMTLETIVDPLDRS